MEAEAKEFRLDRAKKFSESIMSDAVEIQESGGMQLLPDVMNLKTGNRVDIVIRSITHDFWNGCMEFPSSSNYRPRLCVVGIPGIGKSTITAFFIRKLLQEGKTVVYLIRARDKRGWYYEFLPRDDAPIDVNVYR
jgi:polynucleotide 5'-kinase involved in rRNA processing